MQRGRYKALLSIPRLSVTSKLSGAYRADERSNARHTKKERRATKARKEGSDSSKALDYLQRGTPLNPHTPAPPFCVENCAFVPAKIFYPIFFVLTYAFNNGKWFIKKWLESKEMCHLSFEIVANIYKMRKLCVFLCGFS